MLRVVAENLCLDSEKLAKFLKKRKKEHEENKYLKSLNYNSFLQILKNSAAKS